jgi:hypothetical protein
MELAVYMQGDGSSAHALQSRHQTHYMPARYLLRQQKDAAFNHFLM